MIREERNLERYEHARACRERVRALRVKKFHQPSNDIIYPPVPGRSSLDPRHRLARIFARCIKWATASQESAQICANVRRAQALVDSDSDDVYMEPPMVCEKYKMSKIMYNENISWIYLIFGKYFWVLRVRFYFIRPKRMPENRGSLPTNSSFRSYVSKHAS